MGADKTFKYDVAFSFLNPDLTTAKQIHDGLPSSLSKFLFTERQSEIVGTGDGLQVFSTTFRHESRVVVVLFRAGWGGTDWTHIEREAIEERYLKDRSNFLILLALDKSDLPPWYRQHRIYFDLTNFTVEDAVGAIKHRLGELGATLREETIEEQAARAAEISRFNQESVGLFKSYAGVEQASTVASEYLEHVDRLAQRMQNSFPGFRIAKNIQEIGFTTGSGTFLTGWQRPSENNLQQNFIWASIYNCNFPLPGDPRVLHRDPPSPARTFRFTPDRTYGIGWCWKSSQDQKKRNSEELAAYAVKVFLEHVQGNGGRERFQAFFV